MKDHFLIIVTYNPKLIEFSRRVSYLVERGMKIIIVDNCSEVDFRIDGVTIIRRDHNGGIASAQNRGILAAKELGAKSVTFLDQDTAIDPQSIRRLARIVRYTSVAISAPQCESRSSGQLYDIVWWDARRGRLRRDSMTDSHGRRWTNIAISSGLTVSCRVLTVDSLMDEELFIDYVDTEWCLRMSEKGFLIYVLPNVRLVHEIGDSSLDFKLFKLPVHAPSRRYYRIRNSYLLFRYTHVPRMLAWRCLVVVTFQQLLLAALVRGQFAPYIKSYVRGAADGVTILRCLK